MQGRATLALLILLTGCMTATAAAQTAKKQAAQAFDEGQQHYKRASYEKAIAAFRRSYKLVPHYMTTCNIARCYERLSDMVQSAHHYRRCLKEGGDRSKQAETIREAMKSVESQLAVITIESPGTTPAQAFVDGAPVGRTPVEVPINPGPHEIEVRRPGERTERSSIQANIGESRTIVLQTSLVQPPPPKPVETPKRTGLSPLWFWTGVSVTAGLAIAGTILGALTLKANGDYEDDPTEEGYNRVLDRRLVTNVVWGLAAGTAAGTATLFFFTDFKGSQGERREAFVLGVQGTF